MDRIFILHADHEQNASTSTVRLCGSSGTNPFAAIAAGVACLWGPAHGGANEAALNMLEDVQKMGGVEKIGEFIRQVKDKNSGIKLMGFGHRVYKNYDPRAKLMRETCHEVLDTLGLHDDPIFKLAMALEKIALEDEYFVARKLYPNVDFYSGIVQRAIGIPVSLFTAIFALARTVGWIAQLNEMIGDPEYKIGRPRQLYTGAAQRDVKPIAERADRRQFLLERGHGACRSLWCTAPTNHRVTNRTLYDKLWDEHVVHTEDDGTARPLHRPPPRPRGDQPAGLRGPRAGRPQGLARVGQPRGQRPQRADDRPLARHRRPGLAGCRSTRSTPTATAYGITQFKMNDQRQGIVHVIGPEQGATLPGMTVVCGDSHTSTHGAFGALAHGIGTSEVEHVLATQTLLARKAKNMLVRGRGHAGARLHAPRTSSWPIIGKIGTAGGTGYTIEFAGARSARSRMEGRMTVCNMAIEAGARAGLVGVDETTIAYVQGPAVLARPASSGSRPSRYWRTLHSDPGAHWDRVVELDAAQVRPQVTWGTSPEMVVSIGDRVPDPEREKDAEQARRDGARAAATWRSSRTSRSPTSASTRSSSARAPTRASRTCARRPRSCAGSAARVAATSSSRWSCRARAW